MSSYVYSVNYSNGRMAKMDYYNLADARKLAKILSIEKKRQIYIRNHTLDWHSDSNKVVDIWMNGKPVVFDGNHIQPMPKRK